MLVRGPGWLWRVALTLLLEMFLAVHGGMFHGLLLWGASAFALYVFQRQPSRGLVLAYIVVGLMLLAPLEQAKFYIRSKTWTGDAPASALFSMDTVVNSGEWLSSLGNGLVNLTKGDLDPDFMSYVIARYNQGWIINRVMETVPAVEPYAKGATLKTDLLAALLPRVLAPNKLVAGGQDSMVRYANYQTAEGTSMNLGFAGEMYANFGYWGGILGCFGYALTLGLAFRWVCRRTSTTALWWVFVPYVGISCLKAEEGIGEVWNWVTKATLICVAIYFAFPSIRAALSGAASTTPAQSPAHFTGRARSRRLRAAAARAPQPLKNAPPALHRES
jgi:hypothetical protein